MRYYELDHRGRLVEKNTGKTADDLMLEDRITIVDSLNEREKASFLLGLYYVYAFHTKREINADRHNGNPGDIAIVHEIERSLEILGLSDKITLGRLE